MNQKEKREYVRVSPNLKSMLITLVFKKGMKIKEVK